jgi:hypothetical protein
MDLPLIFSITGLVFWAFSFLYLRSYITRKTGKDQILADFRDEFDKLLSEIDTATDRDVSLVEDRIKALKAILDETDRRIGTYKREIERRSTEEKAYGELKKYVPRFAPSDTGSMTLNVSEDTGKQESREDTKRIHVTQVSDPIKPKEKNFSERVAELHRAGFSSDLIANRLGSTVAEVDLAVALLAGALRPSVEENPDMDGTKP